MGSLQEKMKTMPRVSAEAGEMIVIETLINGVSISEAICFVKEISDNIAELTMFNPHDKVISFKKYQFKK